MKYARIVNDTAVDVRTEAPQGCFTPDIAAQFVEVPDEVENGWTLKDGAWSGPEAVIPTPVGPVVIAPKVSPVEFKLLFTVLERVAIKQSTDPAIVDFYEIVNDPRLSHVDLGLQSTKDAIGYLQSSNLLTAERAADILAGKPL